MNSCFDAVGWVTGRASGIVEAWVKPCMLQEIEGLNRGGIMSEFWPVP